MQAFTTALAAAAMLSGVEASPGPQPSGCAPAEYEGFEVVPFLPVLLPESAPTLTGDGTPVIDFVFELDINDLNPTFEFPDCTVQPTGITSQEDETTCTTNWYVQVAYADDCNFEVTTESGNVVLASEVTLQAEYITAVFQGEQVYQSRSRPMKFQLSAPVTLSTESAIVTLVNSRVCPNATLSSPECNDQECLEDGQCECDTVNTGLDGQTCDDDVEPPVFTECNNDTHIFTFTGFPTPTLDNFPVLGAVTVTDNVDTLEQMTIERWENGNLAATGPSALDLANWQVPANAVVLFEIVVSDRAGNTANMCQIQVEMVDVEDPVISCPDPFITRSLPTVPTANATDNVLVTYVGTDATLSTFVQGEYAEEVVVYLAEDAAGNNDTCSILIRYDPEDPVLDCQTITLNIDTDVNTVALPSDMTPTVTDDSETTLTFASDEPLAQGTVYSCSNAASCVFDLSGSATDEAGNTGTCTGTITLVDVQDPNVLCRSTILTMNTIQGENYADLVNGTELVNSYSDAVGVQSIVWSSQPLFGDQPLSEGARFEIGDVVATVTVSDYAGNTASCDVTIRVTDNETPIVNCPDNMILDNDEFTSEASHVAPGIFDASDNDSGLYLSLVEVGGPTYAPYISITQDISQGNVTYRFTATDPSNNTATCDYSVIVIDVDAPTFNCPSALTLEVEPDSDTAFLMMDSSGIVQRRSSGVDANPVQTINLNTADNYDTVHVPYACDANGDNCDSVFTETEFFITVGFPTTQILSYVYIDAAGNKLDACTLEVIVVDPHPPVLNCPVSPQEQTLDTRSLHGTMELDYVLSDNDAISTVNWFINPLPVVGHANVTVADTKTSVSVSAVLGLGDHLATLTATDPTGNSAQCNITVTIVGKCGDALLSGDEECELGHNGCEADCTCGQGFVPTSPEPSFDCKYIVDPGPCDVSPDPDTPAFCPLINRTIHYLRKDYVPRTTCDPDTGFRFEMEVYDYPGPVKLNGTLEAGDWITIELCPPGDPISAPVKLLWSLDGVNWTNTEDTCAEINGADAPATYFNASSGCYEFHTCHVGPEFITGTLDEDCDALFQCDEADLIVTGTTEPFLVTWDDAQRVVITENGVLANVTVTSDVQSGSFFALDSRTTVTYTATHGDITTTCQFDLVVKDGLAPDIFGCPEAELTIGTDDDVAYATIENTYLLGNKYATDTVDGSVQLFVLGTDPSKQYAVGTHTFTYQASDAAGNVATCPATWTVYDDQAPDITCVNRIVLPTDLDMDSANFTANVTSLSITSGDNYDPNPNCTLTGVPALGIYPVGVTRLYYTCVDASGNEDVCMSKIKVVDTQFPEVTCGNLSFAIGNDDAPFSIPLTTFRSAVTSWDNVAIEDEQFDSLGPYSAPWDFPHTFELSYSVGDAQGQTDTCQVTVTFTDVQTPELTCPESFSDNIEADVNSTLGALVSATDYDVDGAVITWDHDGEYESFPIVQVLQDTSPSVLVTYTAVDPTGNVETCTFPVTLIDDEDPVLTCPDITVYLSDNGYEAVWTLPTATDNTEADVLQIFGPTPGSTLVLGGNLVTVIATDIAGNQDMCSFNVILEDDVPPVVDCSSIPAAYTLGIYTLGPAEAFHDLNYQAVQDSYSDDSPMQGDMAVQLNGLDYTDNLAFNFIRLGVGTHVMTFFATDTWGNTGQCEATIQVIDISPPTLVCSNITIRSTNQADDSAVVNWFVNPNDNVGAASVVSTPYTSGSVFFPGSYDINVVVTDTSGNNATCDFSILVLPAFPSPPTYEAVVDKMQAVNIGGDDYAADIIFRTGAEWPYTISVVGTQDADILQLVEAPAYKASNCPEDEFVGDCYQQFNARVLFESCDIATSEHTLRMQADCVHGGCDLSSFQFDLELFITIDDNLCEAEDLGDITITATMTTHTPGVRIAWEDAGADLTSMPAVKTIFNSDELVAAIIAVRTDALQVNGVTIRNVTKTFYSDSALTAQIASVPLVNDFAISAPADSPTTLPSTGADFATFQVFSQDVPLDTTVFTKFEATVDVEYRLRADDTVVRRRLLTFEGVQDARTGEINMMHAGRTLQQADENPALSDTADCDSEFMLSSAQTSTPGADCTTVILSLLGAIPATATKAELEAGIQAMLMGLLGASADEMVVVVLTSSTSEVTAEVSICGENARVHAGLLGALVKGPGLGDSSLFIGGEVIPVDSDPNVFFVSQNDGVEPNGDGDPEDPTDPNNNKPPVADEDGPPVVIIAAAAAAAMAVGCCFFCFFLYKRRKNEDKEETMPGDGSGSGPEPGSFDAVVQFDQQCSADSTSNAVYISRHDGADLSSSCGAAHRNSGNSIMPTDEVTSLIL